MHHREIMSNLDQVHGTGCKFFQFIQAEWSRYNMIYFLIF